VKDSNLSFKHFLLLGYPLGLFLHRFAIYRPKIDPVGQNQPLLLQFLKTTLGDFNHFRQE
jgi:hypothetical protein